MARGVRRRHCPGGQCAPVCSYPSAALAPALGMALCRVCGAGMTDEHKLAEDALKFAKQYVALVDALMKEGVQEQKAREEARTTSLIMMFEDGVDEEGALCPLCGQAQPDDDA